MFFGIVVPWWLAPLVLPVLFVIWLLYHVFRIGGFLLLLALQALGPLVAAVLVGWLGRLDARGADRLETAEDRRQNGKQQRQERAAYSALYSR